MEKKDTISIDTKRVLDFLKHPRFQWSMILVFLLIALYLSVTIRTANLPLLIDQTSGEYIPTALDPFYFMRMGETYVENNGMMPAYDPLRYNPVRETLWNHEVHPYIVATMYSMYTMMSPGTSFRYFYIISPVIFFAIGLVLFFSIGYFLTKDKWIAALATIFLAFVPGYLYRTMAGFADHESIGMASFFTVILIYLLSMYNIGRKKDHWYKSLLYGCLLGFTTTLTYFLWSGVVRFIVIIIPISVFLIWIFNTRKKNGNFIVAFLLYYISWIGSAVIATLFFDKSLIPNILSLFSSSEGIISIVILGFMLIDTLYMTNNIKYVRNKMRVVYSLVTTAIIGMIGLMFTGRNPVTYLYTIVTRLLKPLGYGRFGSTVAENQTPYLDQWIAQSGNILFWLFVFGVFLFGYQLTKKIKNLQQRIILYILYLCMVAGIIFSKYSASSILNGDSFVSVLFYFVPLILFWVYFFIVYHTSDFKWSRMETFLFAWMFFTIISGRGAARVFFVIMPQMVLMAAYFVIGSLREYKISKDKTLKVSFLLIGIVALFFSLVAINQSYQAIEQTAQYTGPSAHVQWQLAMDWVRDNTPEESVFVHWWDYGYWVESLGERRTVADGGHFQGSEDGNHKIGRYVLTTQNPKTALSYFKSMNTTHLLIDPTELGKYSAYSRIGSDDNWDRFSIIPVGLKDSRYTTETANQTTHLYNIQGAVDEDIQLNNNGSDIFLPGPTYTSDGTPNFKSYLAGVYLRGSADRLLQPEGVYVYNSIQQRVPLRYLYFNEQLYDFGSGLDAVIYILPSVNQGANGGVNLDQTGAMIYLSPKVSKSLYAQLYLLDDSFDQYPTVTLVHSEDSPVVSQLKSFNASINEFVYYQGLQGPIKIWETNYPEDTPKIAAFYEYLNRDYAGLDHYFE